MLAVALASSLAGLDGHLVRVEVEAARGIPSFELVGLAATAVRESRVRVKSALFGIGVDLSECSIVVNMAPADVRKTGTAFDLAIAVAICGAVGAIPTAALTSTLFLGELSLAGNIGAVRGALPQILAARGAGARHAIVPEANGAEASLVEGVETRVAETLADVVAALRGERPLPRPPEIRQARRAPRLDDLRDVRGQPMARRALEVCAAGGHNLLLVGPPGSGKTMLARRLPTILPPLEIDEALQVMAIHSVAGAPVESLLSERPFRAPHHTVSEAGLVGGGADGVYPGEVSLAHRGVLFLDELPEFRRNALEALRQPLEDGIVCLARARSKARYPAQPLVVGAMNPCACGYHGDRTGRCACSPERIRSYRLRISGPLLDRFDLQLVLPPVSVAALQAADSDEESSAEVRDRVLAARQRQASRAAGGEVVLNACLRPRELNRVAKLCAEGARLLGVTVERLGLSARAYGKVLRVARTLADLAGEEHVLLDHVAEAIGYRALDRPQPVSSAA